MNDIEKLFVAWINATANTKKIDKEYKDNIAALQSDRREEVAKAQVDENLAYGKLLAAFGDEEVVDGIERMPFDPNKKDSYEVKFTETPASMLKRYPDKPWTHDVVQEKISKKTNESVVKKKLASGEWHVVHNKVVDENGEIIPFLTANIKRDDFKLTREAKN